ncbi:MAG: hypothetical protein A2038_00875 [Deltaproteobacteria bacterium GWA2_57_13]|nr:MAG: hypothetical protein A2038_00875 [Deltaproteobacteria bacterium GWA2_57_13]
MEETLPAPLSGIRVLDFTHVLAGPFCTRLLADLGADVVRVESSKHPDHPWPSAFKRSDGRPASYLNTSRSKRSIAINLKNENGQKIATRLAAVADIVTENFSAGVMARLKLDYETLRPLNPRLIYASMSGYGHNGPHSDWMSMNMNLQGYGGLMMVTGAEGDPPTAISNSWNDYIGGLHACSAILHVLAERVVSGVGQKLDLSQFEGSVAMIAPLVLSSAVNKTSPRRLGNRSPSVAPQGVYRCAGSDEWCAISVQNDGQWQAMVAAMGNPAWGTDPRFTTILGRLRHHDEIDGYIEAWTKQLPNTEVERRLKAVGVPAERMRRIQDLIDAHDGTEVFKKMEEPEVGSMLTTWLPFTLSLSQFSPPRPAPSLGGNTREVLESWLDLSEGEIDELKTQGVLV